MKNIQLFVPKFRKEEIFEQMSICIDKGWTGLGFKTVEIEEEWKNYTGLPHAHFLNSNTAGLHLAVKILKDSEGWEEGDEIITTPLTFVSTNNVILHENLKPVFADVDEFLCLNPDSVIEKITSKTRAIIFVGIGGNTGNLNRIIDICQQNNIRLILDAAHMAGTFIKRNDEEFHVGKFADVTVFSFQAVKNLPTADSGMICFNSEEYDSIARKLSWLGITKDTFTRTSDKGTYKWEYDLIDAGYKYNGNSIMASMALVALRYLEEDNQFRRDVSEKYESMLSVNGIETIKTHSDCIKSSRHLFQIVVNNRNEFMELLNQNGIYPGVHYRDNTNYKIFETDSVCENSKRYSDNLISLPLHLFLTEDDVDYVIQKVIEINKKLN